MKKLTKITALALSLLLVVSVFGACGKETADVQTDDKYSYWVSLDSRSAETVTSYNDLLLYQEISKATGVEVEFIHPAQGTTGSEAFQILMSSGDYPDIMEYSWSGYTGGPDQAINDGIIIALNDYLEEYAPNYYAAMEGLTEEGKAHNYKASAVSTSGNFYGFKSLNISAYGGYGGIYVRKDMLDDWGLDVPVTIDDWTNVFKTAKENGVKYPLTGGSGLFSYDSVQAFNNGWNVGKGLYLDNGQVKFGPFEAAYKDYLKQIAEWSKAGYIDIDFVTNSSDNIMAYMTNGTSVASMGYVGSGLGKLLPAMEEKDPDYSVVACPFPVMNEGDEPLFQEVETPAADPCAAISYQCGAEDENRYFGAMKWLDYLYSDEGLLLKSFGIEGETYTVEKDEEGNDRYVYTDVIYDHEKIGAHSVQAALYHFFRPAGAPGFSEHPDYLNGFYPYKEQKEAIIVWNKYVENAREHVLPSLAYTGEEATQRANILANGRDNLNAAIMDIILGKKSIESFDDAIAAAKKAGYDDLIKITQAAYDRYVNIINE